MHSSDHRPYQGYPYVSPPVHDAPYIGAYNMPGQGTATMNSSYQRPYQGYPYVNPPVHDAPSIDAETAARWSNLPRKQVTLPVKRMDPVVYIKTPDEEDAETPDESPMGQESLPNKPDPDPNPVIYIDMPEASGNHVATGRHDSSDNDADSPSADRQEHKRDPGDAPMVYIDMPEGNGSGVTSTHVEDEPEYVQETIFYDTFENRRIEMNKDSPRPGRDVDSESEDDVSTISSNSRPYQEPVRRPLPPIRPSTLDLYGPGSSGVVSPNQPLSSSGLPPTMSKETMLYQGEEGFPIAPIPVSEFPEPPPAYAEIDRVSSPVVPVEPVVEQPRRQEPPRTQVILPREHTSITPIGNPNSDRKYLNCHHCGMRVHTLVVKENGTITHVISLMCLIICVLPVVLFIYCTDYLKIKNHYCPNCNKIIGYELPFTKQKIVYVN